MTKRVMLMVYVASMPVSVEMVELTLSLPAGWKECLQGSLKPVSWPGDQTGCLFLSSFILNLAPGVIWSVGWQRQKSLPPAMTRIMFKGC